MFIRLRRSRWWKVALVVAAVGLVMAPAAVAHNHHPSMAHAGGALMAHHPPAPPCGGCRAHTAACLTLTVVQQTYVHPDALAEVEYVTELQSLQLSQWYGTPCVGFGPGGWPVYLQSGYIGGGSYAVGGYHQPGYAVVDTGETPYTIWARAFTHEVAEMLVDPGLNRWVYFGASQVLEEVCDPVENYTYSVLGVQVSDFVLPMYYNIDWHGMLDEAGALYR